MAMDFIRANSKESCLHQDSDIKTTCVQNVACNHQTETPKSVYLLKNGQMIPTNLQVFHPLAEPSFVVLFDVLCYLLFVCIDCQKFLSTYGMACSKTRLLCPSVSSGLIVCYKI